MSHDDRALIKSIMDGLFTVPRYLPPPDKFVPYEECLEEVNKAVAEFVRNTENDPDAIFMKSYYQSHKYRFAQTLSHIPLASGQEKVLEVGGGLASLFTGLLYTKLGYRDFTGFDRLIHSGDKTTVINGETINYKIIFFDMNKTEEEDISAVINDKFDIIFFFDVFEHLWHPVNVLRILRTLLKPSGKLYLTTPNSASAHSLIKLFGLSIPQTYNGFNDNIEEIHFKEHTPLSLKYALAHAGMKELAFDGMNCFAWDGLLGSEIKNLYPFPGQPEVNALLQADTMFSVSEPSSKTLEKYPAMFYDPGRFLDDFFNLYPQRRSLSYYLQPSKETMIKSSPVMNAYINYDGSSGASHNAQTIPVDVLLELEKRLPVRVANSVETGCGLSTIFFSNISGHHLVFALDDREITGSSVDFFMKHPLTRLNRLELVYGPTQITLPSYNFIQNFDVVLIDGPHGYPFPDLEYFYLSQRLKKGGFLIIDDLNIPNIGRMADFIAEDEMFELLDIIGCTGIFKRTRAETFNMQGDGWWTQRYNRRRISPRRPIHLNDGSISDQITSLKLDVRIFSQTNEAEKSFFYQLLEKTRHTQFWKFSAPLRYLRRKIRYYFM